MSAQTPGRRGAHRCLLVTKEFSTTPTSGGMLRTLAMFEQLAAHYEVTVISPDEILVARPDGTRRRQPPAAVPGGVRGRIEQAATFERYRSISGVRIGGTALLANLRRGASGHYGVGIVDHTCLAGLADGLATGCDTVLVSMHNIESDLMDQRAKAAQSPASGVPMAAETRLLRRLEAEVAARYPLILTTQADADALPGVREAIVCRNGIFPATATATATATASATTARPPAAERPPFSMVFSGALDWEPNIAGLVWFAREVWPQVIAAQPRATVTVAGRNPTPAVVQACDRPGITVLANVPDMAPVLDAHELGIVPLLAGGGSRIKILEYLAAGIDVISTEVGASGLEDIPADLVDRLPADPAVFAQALVARMRSPRGNRAQAQDWVRKNYAWDVTMQPLLDRLS